MHRLQCDPCADARAIYHVETPASSTQFANPYFPRMYLNCLDACLPCRLQTVWTLICIYHHLSERMVRLPFQRLWTYDGEPGFNKAY